MLHRIGEIMSTMWCMTRKYPAMQYRKYRHLLNKIQSTRNTVHRTMTPHPLQSRHLGTSHSSPNFVDYSPYMSNIIRCSACCRPSRMWITFNKFSALIEAFAPHFYLHFTNCVIPKSLLDHLNSFCRGMFKFNTKFDRDLLLYSFCYFECDGQTVYTLTQWHLSPPTD